MRKLKLSVLNRCTEEELLQEAQQKLELLKKKSVEFDPDFPTYCNSPNNFDISKAIQYLKGLEEYGVKVNPSVALVLTALHQIGAYHKSGYFLTRFSEIKMHSTYMDRETIRNALRFLHEKKLIIFITGRGFRETLIVLRMFDELNNQKYKTKILAKDLLLKRDESIQLNPKYAEELFKKLANKYPYKTRKSYFYKHVGGKIPQTVGGTGHQTVGGMVPPTQNAPIYIVTKNPVTNIEKENLIKEKDKEEGKAINCNQSVNEITINTNIKETEARIKNNLKELKLVLEHKVKRREDGVWYEIPYDEEQKCRIKELVRFIQEGLSYINEQRKLQNKPVIERKYTTEQIIWYAKQDETKQELLFK